MNGDIDSAFVEIAARASEVDASAERLVPLYEDPAPDPPGSDRRSRAAWRVFVGVVLALIAASVFGLFLIAVWLGRHGMLSAPH